MGCCAGADSATNSDISRHLSNCKRNNERVRKLLFLGSGGSGKSTFFKQMCLIHGDGFTPADRSSYHIDICAQVLEQISTMLEEIIDAEIAHNIQILWAEAALKTVYEERAILHIDDSISYFLDNIERVGGCKQQYIPTDMDIIRVRHKTTGFTSKTFIIQQNGFSIYDVGGQQSERRKWIQCFEDVTAVIFVASLSCYNESVFETRDQNAMHDTLELFDEICNNKWFVNTPIILFLNKNDLFREKIHKRISLNICFDDFKEDEYGNDGNITSCINKEDNALYFKCLQFIKEKFQEKNYKYDDTRGVHMHVTTATDTSNVQYVFHSVQALIISESLRSMK